MPRVLILGLYYPPANFMAMAIDIAWANLHGWNMVVVGIAMAGAGACMLMNKPISHT